MSYKYLYGFTNEPSDDLSKVIYFGKQDRCSPHLKRVSEHYRLKDPNHEELESAKYVIFTRVPFREDILDLEAYFIQTYKPRLNTIYNSDYSDTLRLSNEELDVVRPFADTLTWYIIPNSKTESESIDFVINTIREMDEIISEAAYCIESRDALKKMTFDEIREIFATHHGDILVLPNIPNSLIAPLYKVELREDYINLYKFDPLRSNKFSVVLERIEYIKRSQAYYIPELDITIEPEITQKRDREEDQFAETTNMLCMQEIIFVFFQNVFAILGKMLCDAEPIFMEGLSLNDFFNPQYIACHNGGFNSVNYKIIRALYLLSGRLTADADDYTVVQLKNFLKGNAAFEKLVNKPITDYLRWFNSQPPEEISDMNYYMQKLNPKLCADKLLNMDNLYC